MAGSDEGFEWDDAKRLGNLEKHGIDFGRAQYVFADPRCVFLRARSGHGERREIAVGVVDGRVLAVVFTRRGAAIRIISARIARRIERKVYE